LHVELLVVDLRQDQLEDSEVACLFQRCWVSLVLVCSVKMDPVEEEKEEEEKLPWKWRTEAKEEKNKGPFQGHPTLSRMLYVCELFPGLCSINKKKNKKKFPAEA